MYGVESVDRWDIKAVYHAIKNSDGVISGGGEPSSRSDKYEEYSILYGYYGTRSIIKKPYYIYSQGIGPITKGYNRLLVKWNLSKASYVSVRDEDSFYI